MSKQMNAPLDRRTIRKHLLVTVSAVALLAWSIENVNAADADKPEFWLEFGGDAMAVSGNGQVFTAPFMTTQADSLAFDPVSPVRAQKPQRYTFDEEAKVSFQPEDSNWIFSASIRYGRSSNRRNVHQQTAGFKFPTTSVIVTYYHVYTATGAVAYAQYKTRHSEKHYILDFEAGKDVGLGMFGQNSSSDLSFGVRVARFKANANIDIKARPEVDHFGYASALKYWRNYNLDGNSAREFHGVGPTVSWTNSMPLAGNPNDGELALDWGVDAAVLFGKQTAKIHHNSTSYFFRYNVFHSRYHHSANPPVRQRSVVVPNIGAFAGISYRFVDANLSIGYRYDTFLNAMDTGVDTAKKSNLTFNGPYASISIGLGD